MSERADVLRLGVDYGQRAHCLETDGGTRIGENPSDVAEIGTVEEMSGIVGEPGPHGLDAFGADVGIQVTVPVDEDTGNGLNVEERQ